MKPTLRVNPLDPLIAGVLAPADVMRFERAEERVRELERLTDVAYELGMEEEAIVLDEALIDAEENLLAVVAEVEEAEESDYERYPSLESLFALHYQEWLFGRPGDPLYQLTEDEFLKHLRAVLDDYRYVGATTLPILRLRGKRLDRALFAAAQDAWRSELAKKERYRKGKKS